MIYNENNEFLDCEIILEKYDIYIVEKIYIGIILIMIFQQSLFGPIKKLKKLQKNKQFG